MCGMCIWVCSDHGLSCALVPLSSYSVSRSFNESKTNSYSLHAVPRWFSDSALPVCDLRLDHCNSFSWVSMLMWLTAWINLSAAATKNCCLIIQCAYRILFGFPWLSLDFLCAFSRTFQDHLCPFLAHSMSLCNREASVCPSVCKLCANRYFYHRSGWITTKLAHDGPQKSPHPGYAQGQGQRSRDSGTSVMSRNVCYTVRSHVLSLHALTLWSTIILSFQCKCQAARYNV